MTMEMTTPLGDVFGLIDWKLLILIVVLARWSRRYVKNILVRIDFTYKVLFLSTLISFVYYYLGKEAGFTTKDSVVELLVTYFTATSFYELIFNPIEKMLKNKFNSSEETNMNDKKSD